ncbi:MAG: hypothetical protein V2J08_01850 [Desulfotignum sp.]|jgi:hypothetical protein|nr:hypothetical protein [Desulfotignum sp.]
MKYPMAGICLVCLLSVFSTGCSTLGKNSDTTAPGQVLGQNNAGGGSGKVVTFEVVGKGLEPENALTRGETALMAERAAVADGYRQLIEKISGVYVDAFMKAGYGTVNQDMITTRAQSWLRGVEVVEIRKAAHNITEAHLQLSIYFAKKDMVWWPSGLGAKATPVEDQTFGRGSSRAQSSGN